MNGLTILGYVSGAIGFVATLVAAYLVSKSTATKTTIQSQKDLIDTLVISRDETNKKVETLTKEHAESKREISNLQGQIDVLKTIPLKEISDDMRKISASQEKIITLLKGTIANGNGAH